MTLPNIVIARTVHNGLITNCGVIVIVIVIDFIIGVIFNQLDIPSVPNVLHPKAILPIPVVIIRDRYGSTLPQS